MQRTAFASRSAALFARAPAERKDSRPPRIMLMTSSLGTGHSRAALAIERGLKAQVPACAVQTLDFWSLMDSGVSQAIQGTYLRLVTEHPDLYHHLYQLDQRCWRDTLENGQIRPSLLTHLDGFIEEPSSRSLGIGYRFDRILFRQLAAILRKPRVPSNMINPLWNQKVLACSWNLLARRLYGEIRRFKPDALVATQVNMGALAANLKRKRKIGIPLTAVMTDFGVHDFWLQQHIDSYCIADESMESVSDLRARTPGRINVTGIPLMPDFADIPSMSEARRLLGLPVARPVILVLGGGLGLGVADVVGALAQKLRGVITEPSLVVVAGRNHGLISELHGQSATHTAINRGQIRVHGWTDHMAAFIRAADVVVGKPGGLTTAEVLACGRPLFSTSCLRGQESFNVHFLQKNKVGGLLSANDLSRQIFLLLNDRAGLEEMQARAWSLGKRLGATSVAARVMESAHSARHAEMLLTQ